MKKILLVCLVLLTQINTMDHNISTNNEVLYDEPVITQTQEIYSKPIVSKKIISQPIITKKIVQQPIIKQQVVQTPIIRQKVVQRPVYTETQNLDPIIDNKTQVVNVPIQVPGKTTIKEQYIQPTVLTKDVQLQINKGQTQYNDMPVITKPTQYTEETVNKFVQAPAKEIYTQPIYQKTIINNNEQVQFQKAEPIYQNNPVITREPILQERTRTETVTRPGKEIFNNTFIQPIVQREHVNVQFDRQPDQQVQLHDIVNPTQYNTQVRTENVHVPANQIITQPVVQNYVHQRNIHHVQEPYVNKVPIVRPYAVPTPVIKKIPVIRKIPVPVADKHRRVHLNGFSSRSNSHGYSSYSYTSHSHSYSHSYKGRGRYGMGMRRQRDENTFIPTPDNYLKLEQIEALRKIKQDAAGFNHNGPDGYYHNFIDNPEAERNYFNVYGRPCTNCQDLVNRDRMGRGNIFVQNVPFSGQNFGAGAFPFNFNAGFNGSAQNFNGSVFVPFGARTTFGGVQGDISGSAFF